MKKFSDPIFGMLMAIINFTALLIAYATDSLSSTLEKSKGYIAHAAGKTQGVAYNAKAWMYKEFALWRIDSCIA